jgi:hypothetical protein
MKLFKIMIFLSVFFLSNRLIGAGIYLWEYREDADRSCCLYLSGVDYCNPNTPCTRHFHTDLTGIMDYITRLLATEKGSTFSYSTQLKQAQFFIRHMYASSFRDLSYHFEQQRPVEFFHNMLDANKSIKSSTSTASTSTAAADKAKSEDLVLKYLIKLGVARPLK